ncbi:MAG: flagellar filament capping protein FliD [bacterium]
MATFQIGGIVSCLNTGELIEQLMALERRPVVRLEQRQLELERKAGAWRDVRSRLTNLLNRVGDLRSATTYTAMKVSSGDEGVVTAAASAGAVPATYEVEVVQLAVTQRYVSEEKFNDINKELNLEGKLLITGKEKTEEITIEAGDSLAVVMRKINDSDAGVRASIVDGYLILTGEDVGQFTLSEDGDNGILDVLNLKEKRQFQEAVVRIDGVIVPSPTNTLQDVIPGVTLNLKGTGTTTVTIAQDTGRALAAVKGFIEQYNSVFDFISSQLAYNAETRTSGALFGETVLMQIQSNLRQMVGNPVEGFPEELKMLAQLGITTGKIGAGVTATGKLELDEEKFLKALEANPDGVANLLKAVGDKLHDELTALTRSTTGIISGREKAVKDRIADLKEQVERWEVRLEKREEALVRQFTAMEKALSQLQSQGTWLAGQIDTLAAGWNYGRSRGR